MNGIGVVLRDARKKTRQTQYEIAEQAGVSRSYYGDVERGRYAPSVRLLSKLGAILNIDLNFLKTNDGNTDT